jgi:flagellar basal-body rod modification protein FlgD
MSVSGIGNATDTTTSTKTAAAATAGKDLQDQFLTLLVTQLQYQDPLSPMDSANFTSQLAQFSSLEQLTSINDGIETLSASQNSLQNAYLANMIGKKVGYESTASDGTPKTSYGTVTAIAYDTGGTYFLVDGATKVALGDIQSIQ